MSHSRFAANTESIDRLTSKVAPRAWRRLHVFPLMGSGVLAAAQIGKAIISASLIRSDLVRGLTATAGKRSSRQSCGSTRLWLWCARCSARSRQREALSRLDDRLLEDIGVTREQAKAEAAKPFWK
jgi:uncharacterized protein YjiS (DUF1127 family)